jgi:hypothetical protein
MVPLMSLWLPILLSAVIVFIASFILHMMLPFHRSDYRKLPAEDDVMDALRKFAIPPGDYMMPCAGGPEAMRQPGFIDKMKKGPVAVMTVMVPGPPSMGANLVQWFVFCVVVSLFAAYITGLALLPGAEYRVVFRLASSVAFVSHALGQWPMSIWYKRAWSTTLKSTIDGLVYALLTGGTLGWLWPR